MIAIGGIVLVDEFDGENNNCETPQQASFSFQRSIMKRRCAEIALIWAYAEVLRNLDVA